MLDLKLETFLVLCETRNYTQTASVLNITQPAVSQHIKHLENHYQAKLLYYDDKRRLHLTEHGKLLRAFAQTVQSDSQQIADRLKADPKEPEEIRIGTITTTGESLVPHMVAEYLKRFPNKKVSMYLGEADALLTQLQSGRIHFCFTDIYCPRTNMKAQSSLSQRQSASVPPGIPLPEKRCSSKNSTNTDWYSVKMTPTPTAT